MNNNESNNASTETVAPGKRELKEQARRQRRRMKQARMWSIWITVVLVLAGGGYWLATAAQKAEENRLGTAYDIVGRTHVSNDVVVDSYNSNPPTSGPHHASPAPWGVYTEPIRDEILVHNLEHGGIWISYNTDDADMIAAIESFARGFPQSVIVTPRAENDAPIVLAAWGRLLKADAFDEETARMFIQQNLNRAPEPLAGAGAHR